MYRLVIWVEICALAWSSELMAQSPPSQDAYIGPCDGYVGQTCPAIDDDVDITVGSLMPIRGSVGSALCNQKLVGGVLSPWKGAELVRWTIERINNDRTLLPDITLGYSIVDTCIHADIALRNAIQHFISPSRSQQADQNGCPSEGEASENGSTASRRPLAVVGALFSLVSIPMTSLLGGFHIPMISPGSTSSVLNDRCRFPYFFRTIPPNGVYVKCLIRLVIRYGWRYVSVIYTDDPFGRDGKELFEKEAKRYKICIGASHALQGLGAYKTVEREAAYKDTVDKLMADNNPTGTQHRRAVVVMVMMASPETEVLFEYLNKNSDIQKANFTFLAPPEWASSGPTVRNANITLGTIGARTDTILDRGLEALLEEVLRNVSLFQEGYAPWLPEVYTKVLGCNASDNGLDCTRKTIGELLDERNLGDIIKLDGWNINIIDSVYAAAQAAHNTLTQLCNQKPNCTSLRSVVPDMLSYEGRVGFRTQLEKVRFFNQLTRKFVGFKSGNPLHVKVPFSNVVPNKDLPGTFYWRNNVAACDTPIFTQTNATTGVCRHDNDDDQIPLWTEREKTPIIFNDGTTTVPRSFCSENCLRGERAVVTDRQYFTLAGVHSFPCCWNCKHCLAHEYVTSQFSRCIRCQATHYLDYNKTGCVELQKENWSEQMSSSIPVAVVAFVSSMAMICVAFLCYRNNDETDEKLNDTIENPPRHLMIGMLALASPVVLVFFFPPTMMACDVAHIAISIGLCAPFYPHLGYAIYLFSNVIVAEGTKQPSSQKSSSKYAAGTPTGKGKHLKYLPTKLGLVKFRKESPSESEEDDSISTFAKARIGVAFHALVTLIIFSVNVRWSPVTPTEFIVPHKTRIVWCKHSFVDVLGVASTASVALMTSVLSFKLKKRLAVFRVPPPKVVQTWLTRSMYLGPTITIILAALAAISLLSTNAVAKQDILAFGYIFLHLTHFILMFGNRIQRKKTIEETGHPNPGFSEI